MTDDQVREAQVLENLQRADLGPIEEAEGYAVLVGKGLKIPQVAAKLGKHESFIYQRLRLLETIKPVQDALRDNKITVGHALELARVDHKDQKVALANCFGHRGDLRSVPVLREWIDENCRLDLTKAPFPTTDPKLYPAAGACPECPKRTGNDKLLFADIKSGDLCTDPTCFQKKTHLAIDVKIEEIKKAEGKASRLSRKYYADKDLPKGTLTQNGYQIASNGKDCGHTEYGVYVDGDKIGQKAKICRDKSCKVHHNTYSSSHDSAQAKAKRSAEALQQRIDKEARKRAATAYIEAVKARKSVPSKVFAEDVYQVANYAFSRMDHAHDKLLASLLDWDPKLMGWHESGNKRLAMFRTLPVEQVVALAKLAIVASSFTVQHSYGPGTAKDLAAIAQTMGVSLEAIRKTVAAEFAAKKAKNTAVKTKTKPTPKDVQKRINERVKKDIAKRTAKKAAKKK